MEILTDIVLLLFILAFPLLRNAFFATNGSQDLSHADSIRGRLMFYDVARGLCILMVIIGHVLYFYLLNNAFGHTYFLYFINDIIRFAIPVFLIASGVLLDPLDISRSRIGGFFSRKLVRLIVPYVIMTAIVAIYTTYQGLHLGVSGFFEMLITGTAMVPYYFIVVLIQCYILYPLLILWRRSEIFLVLLFCFSLACFLLPPLQYIGGVPFVGPYLFFFAYGIYHRERFLSHRSAERRISREILPWAVIIGLFVFCILALPGEYMNARFFYGVAAFNALYILYPLAQKTSGKLLSILRAFGGNSLWIYLTHFPLSLLAYTLVMNYMNLEYHIGFFLGCIIAIPLSFLVALIPAALYGLVPHRLKHRSSERFPLPV